MDKILIGVTEIFLRYSKFEVGVPYVYIKNVQLNLYMSKGKEKIAVEEEN